MALNPPITDDGEPYRIDYNETFFLQRKGIDFEVKVEGLGKMSGKGKVRCPYLKILALFNFK